MDYIKNLRKTIGHQTIIMPCVSALIFNSNGEILLQKRKDNGLWAIHGGAIEIDENTIDACKREIEEETGLTIDELNLFDVYSGKDHHHVYPNKDEVSIIEIVYICTKFHGELKPQLDEVLELKYFSLDDLPNNMMLTNREIIIDYIQKKR